MANKITTLYEDSAKTTALYPRTKTSAVSDNDGNTLGEVAVYHAQDLASGVKGVDLHLDMDLLWTNASPTSAFAAQTISIDYSLYNFLFIVYEYANDVMNRPYSDNYPLIGTCLIPVESDDPYKKYTLQLNYDRFKSRNLATNAEKSSIAFGNGLDVNSYNNGYQTSTYIQIPLLIYGIK